MSEVLISMKGTTALTIMAAKENSSRAHQILDEVCKKIALNGYGKPAREIKANLLRMTEREVKDWLNNIWNKYISDEDIVKIWSLFADIKLIY